MFPSFLQCRGYFLLTHTMKEALFWEDPAFVCVCRLFAACVFVCERVWLGVASVEWDGIGIQVQVRP